MPSLHLAAVTEGEAPLDTTTLAGKPYFLNVFASWCAPCLAEHALLMKLRAQSGIAIYGISWKDTPEATRRWLQAHGNPYTFAGYDPAGKAAIALGITGVPESFLVNAEGEIVWHWPGPLTEEIVEDTLLPRIKELRQ